MTIHAAVVTHVLLVLVTAALAASAVHREKREPLTLRIHSGGDGVTFNFHPGSTGGDAIDEVEEVAPPPRRRHHHGPVLQGAAGNPTHQRAAASYLTRQGAAQLGAGPRTIHVLAIRSQGRTGSAAQRPHYLSTDERVAMLKDVRVEMLSPVSVLITWRDPLYSAEHEQGGTQRYYTVRYREQVPTAMWAYRTVSRPHLVLGNLRPRAEYEYAVRVSEGRVDGDWCAPAQRQKQQQHVARPLNADQSAVVIGPRSASAKASKALSNSIRRKSPGKNGKNGKADLGLRTDKKERPPPKAQSTNPDKKSNFIENNLIGKWMIDPNTKVLFTPDGNMVYDQHGKPVKLCIGHDGSSVADVNGQAILGNNGSLLYGYGPSGKPLLDTTSSPVSTTPSRIMPRARAPKPTSRPRRPPSTAKTTTTTAAAATTTVTTTTAAEATTTTATTTVPPASTTASRPGATVHEPPPSAGATERASAVHELARVVTQAAAGAGAAEGRSTAVHEAATENAAAVHEPSGRSEEGTAAAEGQASTVHEFTAVEVATRPTEPAETVAAATSATTTTTTAIPTTTTPVPTTTTTTTTATAIPTTTTTTSTTVVPTTTITTAPITATSVATTTVPTTTQPVVTTTEGAAATTLTTVTTAATTTTTPGTTTTITTTTTKETAPTTPHRQAVTTARSTAAPRPRKIPAKPTPRPISRTQARLGPSQTFQANLTSSSPWELGTLSSTPFTEFDIAGKKRFTAPHVKFINKEPSVPCSITETIERMRGEGDWAGAAHSFNDSLNVTVVAIEGCHSFVVLDWDKPNNDSGNITGYVVSSATTEGAKMNKWLRANVSNDTLFPVENLQPNTQYVFKVQAKNEDTLGPPSDTVSFTTESENSVIFDRSSGTEPIWTQFPFRYDDSHTECRGKQFVKRTWYRKFVGVVLCNSLRYKLYISDSLGGVFYNVGDGYGHAEDHCEFVDSFMDGRTGPRLDENQLPITQGFYRRYRQEPLNFGSIGGGVYQYGGSGNYYVAWYECGVPIPGVWW